VILRGRGREEGKGRGKGREGREGENDLAYPLSQIPGYATVYYSLFQNRSAMLKMRQIHSR